MNECYLTVYSFCSGLTKRVCERKFEKESNSKLLLGTYCLPQMELNKLMDSENQKTCSKPWRVYAVAGETECCRK